MFLSHIEQKNAKQARLLIGLGYLLTLCCPLSLISVVSTEKRKDRERETDRGTERSIRAELHSSVLHTLASQLCSEH